MVLRFDGKVLKRLICQTYSRLRGPFCYKPSLGLDLVMQLGEEPGCGVVLSSSSGRAGV